MKSPWWNCPTSRRAETRCLFVPYIGDFIGAFFSAPQIHLYGSGHTEPQNSTLLSFSEPALLFRQADVTLSLEHN